MLKDFFFKDIKSQSNFNLNSSKFSILKGLLFLALNGPLMNSTTIEWQHSLDGIKTLNLRV